MGTPGARRYLRELEKDGCLIDARDRRRPNTHIPPPSAARYGPPMVVK